MSVRPYYVPEQNSKTVKYLFDETFYEDQSSGEQHGFVPAPGSRSAAAAAAATASMRQVSHSPQQGGNLVLNITVPNEMYNNYNHPQQ